MSLLDYGGFGESLRLGRGCRRDNQRIGLDWRGRLLVRADESVCWVTDLSLGGARVRVPQMLHGWSNPMLAIDGVGQFPCHIVWRGRREYGVRFTETPSQLSSYFGPWLPAQSVRTLGRRSAA